MNLRRDVFQAIADPSRRTILSILAVQSLTAGAIAAHFDSARPTISKHIQILTECELVHQEQRGREIYYHLNPQKMSEIIDWLVDFRKVLDERFDRLENVLKKL